MSVEAQVCTHWILGGFGRKPQVLQQRLTHCANEDKNPYHLMCIKVHAQ